MVFNISFDQQILILINVYAKIEKWIVKSDWTLKMVESKLACRYHQILIMELET